MEYMLWNRICILNYDLCFEIRFLFWIVFIFEIEYISKRIMFRLEICILKWDRHFGMSFIFQIWINIWNEIYASI